MRHLAAALLAFATFCTVPALADALRGDTAFARGDYAIAYREWHDLADAGDASAMLAVGSLHDYGRGVPQDFAQALSWYRRAAQAGNASAIFNTGAMYDNGRGTPVNRSEAVRWYGLAAEKGNGRAAYNLGVIYRDGDGVPQDRAAAIRFFRMAAASGLKAAQANLAALGLGPAAHAIAAPLPLVLPSSPPTARTPPSGRASQAALARIGVDPAYSKRLSAEFPTLVEQADKGNAVAQYDVGLAYEYGIVVSRDPVMSYYYYLRSSASRDPGIRASAVKGALDIGKTLTNQQRAAARERLIGTAP